MKITSFKFSENQKIWDSYMELKLEESKNEFDRLVDKQFTEGEVDYLFTKEKSAWIKANFTRNSITPYKLAVQKKKTSIAQYKSAVLDLEEFINKPFTELTFDDIINYMDITKKQKSHVTGFLLTCVTGKLLNVSKDVMLYLVPLEYKQLVIMILHSEN